MCGRAAGGRDRHTTRVETPRCATVQWEIPHGLPLAGGRCLLHGLLEFPLTQGTLATMGATQARGCSLAQSMLRCRELRTLRPRGLLTNDRRLSSKYIINFRKIVN